MSGFLDANEIEKLFARASEGNMPMESEERQGRRARWLRTVDFTRPTKFTTDQERRIRRAMDTFTERAATRLVAEHRTSIELEVIDVGQFTWTNAFAQVPEGSVHIQIDTAPHEGRMLLSAGASVTRRRTWSGMPSRTRAGPTRTSRVGRCPTGTSTPGWPRC